MKIIISILALTLALSVVACSDDSEGLTTGQNVYFEVSYTNLAWGKQFKGILIDKDGKIRIYDKPAKWNTASEKAELSVAQMDENIANTSLSDKTVSATELKENIAKINAIVPGNFSKPVNGGADRGTTSFFAYRFDASRSVYVPVLLGETGDLEISSLDKSSIEIAAWLNAILVKIY